MNENSTPGEASDREQPGPDAARPVDTPAGAAPDAAAHAAPAQPSARPDFERPTPAQAGHDIPGAFGSHQAATGWQPPAGAPGPHPGSAQHAAPAQPGQPAPGQYGTGAGDGAHVGGRAFGQAAGANGAAPTQGAPSHAHTQPTIPLDPSLLATPSNATDQPRRTGGPVKVAALLLAAALVGGAAGFGGSAIGSAVFAKPVSSTESGPETVTVNNPGSVNETTAIATEVLPSVVTIEVAGSQGGGSGSGVILSDDGYVLTNTHVVTLGGAVADPAIRVTTSDGRIYEATVVGTDPIYDLAVIKLEGAKDLEPIEFADSTKLNVGDTAVAVGAPLGLSNSVTTGIISALNRSIQVASAAVPESVPDNEEPGDGSEGDEEGGPFQFDIPGMPNQQSSQSISIAVIQTDAAINPGNSGGALVDSKGELIGINVAIATAGGSSQGESGSIGLGFSIPSNIAKRVADEIIADGAATHGLLGAMVRDAAGQEGATVAGALIAETTRGGAAEDAGLEAGDVVTEFNGVPITGATDLTAQVRAAAAGSTAEVTYVRDGETHQLELELGELKL
ncbi:trypsin-like peptidase domain-containing protein [Microbacterium sp.]|uniref:S1C family serine protease n=1 Tax=Microbacterium sp. TaxID=51671 RepID=UPI002810DEC7|nr:trypsin-like peptidase domain-containing protein [Microbacterium sp.]